MEKYINIPTSDWFEIKWILNWKEKSDRLIIFCHGFQGKLNRHLFHNWAWYFTDKWFHTFRFNFYDSWEKNRKLHQCDFDIHGKDIDTVVEYFQDEYQEIILVWHSFGWLSILYSSQNVSQNVLWDSSLSLQWEDFETLRNIWKYFIDMSTFYTLVNKKMFKQYKSESRKKTKNFLVPTSLICAENSSLPSKWKTLKSELKNLKNFDIIGWANHSFDEEWKDTELFDKTLEFIEQ